MPKIIIIIPTYNEKNTIVSLVDKLFSLNLGIDVLIVDDGQDETESLVKEKQKINHNLFLIKRRDKGGRGSAVLEGIRFGLKRDYQYFVEMDADFSHQPEELPGLLEKAGLNRVVIGSRYVRGSKIKNWPLRRRIFSKFANFYADLILGIGIHDYTNGYRVYGREAIKKLDMDKIKSSGYIVLSEISYQLHKKGVEFVEQKTVFINRSRGQSNFSFKEIKEAFLSIPRIKKRIG